MSYTQNEMIVPRNVEDEMKESYLRYSMSVIISRALPDVRDGLKPSQRRILYAMRQLNLISRRQAPKMRQNFRRYLRRLPPSRRAGDLSYTCAHGARLGDALHAGRWPGKLRFYRRRSAGCDALYRSALDPCFRAADGRSSIKKQSTWSPTTTKRKKSRPYFPAKFPNLLCNGSSGIAVGMATNIPPHNSHELIKATLLLLDNPQTTIEEIMKVMPGPDFPTGGIICGYRGIKEAFHTGRGKIILRGVLRIEDHENGGAAAPCRR